MNRMSGRGGPWLIVLGKERAVDAICRLPTDDIKTIQVTPNRAFNIQFRIMQNEPQ